MQNSLENRQVNQKLLIDNFENGKLKDGENAINGAEDNEIEQEPKDLHQSVYDLCPVGNMSLSTIKNTQDFSYAPFSISRNNMTLHKLNEVFYLNQKRPAEEKEYQITKILYQRKVPSRFYLSKDNNYCMIECDNIKTIYIDNFVFSLFSNPQLREDDKEIDCKFLITRENRFEIPDDDFLPKIKNTTSVPSQELPGIKNSKFTEFIEEFNEFRKQKGYREIKSEFKVRRIKFMLMSCFLFILIACLFVSGFFFEFFFADKTGEENAAMFWLIFIIGIIILFTLIYWFVKSLLYVLVTLSQREQYSIIKFRIKSFKGLQRLLDKWNISLFIPNAIFIDSPITLDYIQFNLDPFRVIELEHHEITDNL